MSVPEAVWNEIKALKASHAELAARVDDIGVRFAAHLRLAVAIESPAPAPDPVCASCGHGSEDHTFGQGECMEPICGCAGFVPTAEPAPLDPVLLDQSELSLLQALIRKALMGQRNDSTRFRLNAINAKLIAYGRDGAR